jgi:hypothetical protein
VLARRAYLSYGIQLGDTFVPAAAYPANGSSSPFYDEFEGPRGAYPLHSASTNVKMVKNFNHIDVCRKMSNDIIIKKDDNII